MLEKGSRSAFNQTCSQTICPLPWLHLSAAHDGAFRVCCNTSQDGFLRREDGSKIYQTQVTDPSEVLNSYSLKKTRLEMLDGRRPKSCKDCYQIEDTGGHSMRQEFVSQWQSKIESLTLQTQEDGSISPEIKYLDLAFGNNCNIRCRMCNPEVSRGLAQEFKEMGVQFDSQYLERGIESWKTNGAIRPVFDRALQHAEKILFTGGEPFVSLDHRALLESAIRQGVAKQIELIYHTNLTIYPKKLIELWSHFRLVNLHFSIDGYGRVNEYIRYPSDWPTIEHNLKALTDLRHSLPMTYQVHTTVQALNLPRLTELLDYLREINLGFPEMPFMILLHQPDWLSVRSLPESIKHHSAERIESYLAQHTSRYAQGEFAERNLLQIRQLRNILSIMLSQPLPVEPFLEKTSRFDRSRKQNLCDLIPEFEPYYRNRTTLPQPDFASQNNEARPERLPLQPGLRD